MSHMENKPATHDYVAANKMAAGCLQPSHVYSAAQQHAPVYDQAINVCCCCLLAVFSYTGFACGSCEPNYALVEEQCW